jgi:Fe-S cluster assembly iron-binding protein IscA
MAQEIVLTEACIRRLQELAASTESAKEGGGGAATMLRIAVDGGGCSGFQYHFSLDSQTNVGPQDKVGLYFTPLSTLFHALFMPHRSTS